MACTRQRKIVFGNNEKLLYTQIICLARIKIIVQCFTLFRSSKIQCFFFSCKRRLTGPQSCSVKHEKYFLEQRKLYVTNLNCFAIIKIIIKH